MSAAITKFERILLLLVIVTGIIPVENAQGFASERFSCPQQSEIGSKISFTRDTIEPVLGFNDPSLDDLENIPAVSYLPDQPYFFYLSCTPQNDSTFVALVYLTSAVEQTIRLRVFRLQGRVIAGEASLDFTTAWMPELIHVSGFADRNFNGLPDIVVSGSDGGNGGFSEMRVVELGKDDRLSDITPVSGYDSAGFYDVDGDGIPEIYTTRRFYVPTFSAIHAEIQNVKQFWVWNSLGIRLIAVEVQAFSNVASAMSGQVDSGNAIQAYLSGLSDAQICTDVEKESEDAGDLRWTLFQMLMYSRAWGDLHAGWAQIHPILLAADRCADSDGKRIFFSALGDFADYFADRSS